MEKLPGVQGLVTTEPYVIGDVGNALKVARMHILVSRKSAFGGGEPQLDFRRRTQLPYGHFIVCPSSDITWDEWKSYGVSLRQLGDTVEILLGSVLAHFYGDALTFDTTGWEYSSRSPLAVRRKTVHAHLLIAHKDLWGENGFIRQQVESTLRPHLILEAFKKSVVEY